MYVYAPPVCSTHKGQERASDPPLELELQMVVSLHVDAGDWPCVLCKSNQLKLWKLLCGLKFSIQLKKNVSFVCYLSVHQEHGHCANSLIGVNLLCR